MAYSRFTGWPGSGSRSGSWSWPRPRAGPGRQSPRPLGWSRWSDSLSYKEGKVKLDFVGVKGNLTITDHSE